MPTAPEEMTLKVIAHIHTAFPTKFGIPRQSGLCGRAARRGDLYARIPQCRCRARSGRFQSHLAGVAVLRRGAGQLVPHCTPAASGRQHPHGRVRPPPRPPPPPGPSAPSGGGGAASRPGGGRRGARGGGCRPDGWHPHLRHQALHPLCRLPPGCRRGLYRPDPVPPSAAKNMAARDTSDVTATCSRSIKYLPNHTPSVWPGRSLFIQKSRRVCARRRKKLGSFFTATCAWGKKYLSGESSGISAFYAEIMRAAACKPLAKKIQRFFASCFYPCFSSFSLVWMLMNSARILE